MRTQTRRLVVGLLAVLSLVAAGCGSSSSGSSSAESAEEGGSSEAQSTKSVSFLTGFGYGPWDAGVAVAQQKGYFEEAGLSVDIKSGQGSSSNLQLVANGNATFSNVGGAPLAIAVQKGVPIRAFASFFQIAGNAVIASPDIKTPQDMEGKTFTGSAYDFTTLLFPLFEKASGISGVNTVNVDPSSIPTVFLQGRAEMMSGVEWAEVPEVEAEGKEFHLFSYDEVGLNTVGPALTASVSTLEKEPETAKAFAEAVAKGYEFTYEHPEEAAEIVHELWPTTQEKFNQAVTPVLENFAHTPATEGKNLGWMSEEDWKQTAKIMVEGEQMPASVEAKKLFENVLPEG